MTNERFLIAKENHNTTYFFDEDTQFNEDFITDANVVIFGNVTCDKGIEASNIIVHGDISTRSIKADRILCKNIFADKINCTSIIADKEIEGNILIADNVRCDTLDITEEIKVRKIISEVMLIYKGQKVDCKELNTVKYYN